jgi:MFS family permease
VLQGRDEPPEEERPPWHWVAIGAVATFLAWLPLAALAEYATRRLVVIEDARGTPAPAGIWLVGAHALAFFTAASLGGLLVGRAGGKAGRREATLAGVAAGALAWLLAAAQGTPGGALVWGLLLAIIAALGALAGHAGGRLGLYLRSRKVFIADR